MAFIYITFILAAYCIQGLIGHAIHSPLVGITGGYSVDIKDAPFMAALLINASAWGPFHEFHRFTCGGSIIHEQFVLTAAHCLFFRNGPLIVRVGSSDSNNEGELHQVVEYISHEKFHGKYTDAGYDVALLKLEKPLTFGPGVAAIKLGDESLNITVGLVANVTGWGFTGDWIPSTKLQRVSVSVSPPKICNYDYHGEKIKIIEELQICSKTEGKGFCSGDSGGPLTVGDHQIGIVSGGSACNDYPNVYLKVPSHVEWIQNKIKENLDG